VKIRDHVGMTLIEVMIASAILLTLALAFSQFMTAQVKQRKRQSDLAQQQDFQTRLQEQLNPANSIEAYRRSAGMGASSR